MIVKQFPSNVKPYTNLFGDQYWDDGQCIYEPRKNSIGEDVFIKYPYKRVLTYSDNMSRSHHHELIFK